MLPSKSMMEYTSEMNRLFSRLENDDPPTPYPFNLEQSMLHSAMVNRSSSSTDSTSPESYPDLSYRYTNYRPLRASGLQDTPFVTRPQRAIVGRKILGSSQQTTRLISPVERRERDCNFTQHDEALCITPPAVQHKHNLYELFPSENKAFEFKTPVKSEHTNFNISPNFPDRSPLSRNSLSNRSLSSLSPMPNQTYRPHNLSNQLGPPSHWSNSLIGSSIPSNRHHDFISSISSPRNVCKYSSITSCMSTDEIAPSKMCTFCRKNGETPIVYMTHSVKEQVGNKNVVTCPILRSHVCVTCGASGDNAHTITYCPVLRSNNDGKPLHSTTITLKNTRIKSNGRRRY